jgi:hypothetical protein
MERFDYSLPIINEHVPLLPERLREDPLHAIKTTKNNLELHLDTNTPNKKVVDDSLMNVSIPYLQRVADAYPRFFSKDPTTMLTHSLPEISATGTADSDRIRASVDYFRIVFALLQKQFADPAVPERYRYLDAVKPPVNPFEAQQRVMEMSDVISTIVRGVPIRPDVSLSKPQLVRTLAFFDAGSSLAYDTNRQLPKGPDQLEYEERLTIGHLLDGVEVKSLREFEMEENERKNTERVEQLAQEEAAERKKFNDLLGGIVIDFGDEEDEKGTTV